MTRTCPRCNRSIDQDETTWPIWKDTEIVEGGCQECWEEGAAILWNDFVGALRDAMAEMYPLKEGPTPLDEVTP